MSSEVRFEVQIIGYRPPYRWKLWRSQPGVNTRVAVKRGPDQIGGEADVFEDAVFDAQEAAKTGYEEWLQENTFENVEVLRGPAKVERRSEIPVIEPRRPNLEQEPQLGGNSD